MPEADGEDYLVYERDGEWTLAAGVRAAIELDSDELRLVAGDVVERQRWTGNPGSVLGEAVDRLLLTTDRLYGWVAFEFGAYRFGMQDRLPPGTPLAHIFHLRADTAERLGAQREPQILVNYLGRFHQEAAANALQSDRTLLTDASRLPEPNLAVRHELTLMAAVLERDTKPVLGAQWRTLPDILSAADVAVLQALWLDALREVS